MPYAGGMDEKAQTKLWDAMKLWDAAREGDIPAIRKALAAGADVNAPEKSYEGQPPLILAAGERHFDAVKALLDSGADANGLDKQGRAPLHVAATLGMLDMACLLVARGADIGGGGKNRNIASTPLHQAAWGGHVEVVRFLLGAGADIEATDVLGERPLHFAAACDYWGTSGPARGEHPGVVRLLLEMGAKVDCPDNSGFTSLHVAARDGCPETAKVLVAAGVDVDAADVLGERPLHLAVLNDQRAVATVLLEAGADPSIKDENGLTPLMWAKTLETLKWLKEEIARIPPGLLKARMFCEWRERHRRLAILRPKGPSL